MNAPQSLGTWFLRLFRLLPRLVFWAGVVLLCLCLAASWPPGGALRLFALPWCLLPAGLFVPRWRYRIASVVLISFPVNAVVEDYRYGIEFQHWVEQRELQDQAGRQKAMEKQVLPPERR